MKNINDPMGLLESILESIDQHAAGPELKDAKELENKATEEKEPVELASDADNKDVYPADEHKQEEDVDAVVVESEQVAAGPELEAGKELENEATEENAAEPEAKELDNKDVFSSDEHEEAEDSDGVVVESEQVAAGPELKDAKELENEATEENKVEVSAEEVDNKDVYPADEHKQEEDVVELTERSIAKVINSGNKAQEKIEKTHNTANYKADVLSGVDKKQAKADLIKHNADAKAKRMENHVDVAKDAAGVKTMISQKQTQDTKLMDKFNSQKEAAAKMAEKDAKIANAQKEKVNSQKQQVADLKAENKLKRAETTNARKEAARNATTLRGKIRARLGLAEDVELSDLDLMKFLESEGTEMSVNAIMALREEIDLKEDELETNPVVKDAEDAGVASDEKAEDGKDMEKEDTAEESKDDDEAVAEEDKADEDKDSDEKEDSEDMNESMNAVFALLDKINESVQNAAGPELEAGKELENEATDEKAPEAVASEADNKDVYSADEHEQKEEVEGVVVESEQVAAGPELEAGKELENEATEEKDPVVAEPDTDNKDVYCDVCHKQVEDVVEVVIEAASRCKSNGVKATKENIIKEAKQLLEAEEIALKVEKPAEKEYDVDASIESAEMNGNDEKFESYDDIQGDGSEAAKDEDAEVKPEDVQESVNYKSLREACLLDEGYFMTDSYIKETADEKQTKLTEQVSLLMARDAMDPMYDELLRESIHCMRLQEALVKKYGSEAAKRADMIINK